MRTMSKTVSTDRTDPGQRRERRSSMRAIVAGYKKMPSEFTYNAYKLVWTVLRPGNLLVLLLACGAGLAVFGEGAIARSGGFLIGLSLLSMLAILLLPIGSLLLAPLERRHRVPRPIPEAVAGFVVLGGAVEPKLARDHAVISMNTAAERMMAVPLLARKFPDAKIVVTGGDAQHRTEVGATARDVSERYFTELGLAGQALLFEGSSRNTRENALLTKALVAPRLDETWLLVTSAWHMPRALGTFRALDWQVEPYPVDYRSFAASGTLADLSFARELALLELAIQEWTGLMFYRLLGWI